mmetsp:Transcript_83782/g.250065  ORF Transcript_83782/g.250065 Transcript_83782/m.250065 type:complete len:229 (+) Transcript_83782:303-989(+)
MVKDAGKTNRAAQRKTMTNGPAPRASRLQELEKPLQGLRVTALDHADHEELDGARPGAPRLGVLAAGRVGGEPQGSTELLLRGRSRNVDLVPEHQEGDARQGRVTQKVAQLLPRLLEARAVGGIYEEDDGIRRGKVVPYEAPRPIASDVVRPEAEAFEGDLLRVRMQCRHVRSNAVILEHVQERRLARVVQPQEQNLRNPAVGAPVARDIEEPVDEKHGEEEQRSAGE